MCVRVVCDVSFALLENNPSYSYRIKTNVITNTHTHTHTLISISLCAFMCVYVCVCVCCPHRNPHQCAKREMLLPVSLHAPPPRPSPPTLPPKYIIYTKICTSVVFHANHYPLLWCGFSSKSFALETN